MTGGVTGPTTADAANAPLRDPEKRAELDRLSARGGLIAAYRLDKHGGGTMMSWDDLQRDPLGGKGHGDTWIHLDRSAPRVQEWLINTARLPHPAVLALLAPSPRSRAMRYPAEGDAPEGVLFVLRGVNLNDNAEPEDMVALRIWVDEYRIITLRKRVVMAVKGVQETLQHGIGPRESGELLIALAIGLLDRIDPIIDELEAQVRSLEDRVETEPPHKLRPEINRVRRSVVRLHRHLAPQREALREAWKDLPTFFSHWERQRLHGAFQRTASVVEDLEEVTHRADIVHDDITVRGAERTNRITTGLTVVAAVFLPMGLIAGIWGMNTPGLPFGGPSGFAIVLAIMLATGIAVWIAVQAWINRV